MVAAYNPFEILNLPMIRRITQHGNHFIVQQRFNWPGIKEGHGFMATPYKDEKSGKAHAVQLEEKEGKLLNLPADIDKIAALINNPKYSLFLCTLREESWSKKMIKLYQRNMISYIKSRMPITSNDAIGIHLDLKFGRLKSNCDGKRAPSKSLTPMKCKISTHDFILVPASVLLRHIPSQRY